MGVFISKSAAIYCGANAATLALTVFFKKEIEKRKRNSISCQEEEGKARDMSDALIETD